ncbi:MAG: hypothetical protein E7314_04470 [Clostridiales bacterium]|nr:hypothetical protein [Clostridiales bacterium]
MAKIEYHKDKIELPETKKIKSIVGQKYLDDYEKRKEQATKRMQKNGKTYIEAEEIVVKK